MRVYKTRNLNNKAYNAFVGLKHVLLGEMSIQIHLLFFFCILYFANVFSVTRVEWLILILAFTAVISLEMVNTLAEELCDLYTLDKNLHIKKIKDIAAGAVLLASLSLLVIIGIIFLPYLK